MNRLRNSPLPTAQFREALSPGPDALPDPELLDRFARYADHDAFAALVRRHGRMVYSVCRRMLAPADADDAFQATFLVLIRKARTVRGERLGPWLFGVACRVSLKVRSREARRAEFRTEATDMIPAPNPPADAPDWLPILDAELNALPAKYRDPLVLCELQGTSRAAAAKALGVPGGTLSSRLSRGRELLRRRLLKHGTLLPAGGLTALFGATGAGRAAVPAALLARTAELAKVATVAAPAGAVPVGAARLTDEVLKSMFLTKLRVTAGAVVALALVAVGAAAIQPGDAPDEKGAPKAAAPPGRRAAAAAPQPQSVAGAAKGNDRDAVQGLWVLDKCDLGKGVKGNELREMQGMLGKMRFLVAGDVWWLLTSGPGGAVIPQHAKLDPGKNPKWLDLRAVKPLGFDFAKCIYELDGNRLRVCVPGGAGEGRPAEFDPEDDTLVMRLEFRHEKLPPAAGAKELLGTWAETGGRNRVEVLGGYIFVLKGGNQDEWLGGRYTVDETKNPKWIDIELAAPRDEKVTRLYGSYEATDGQLELAVGATGRRAARPLEFAPDNDALLFAGRRAKGSLIPRDE